MSLAIPTRTETVYVSASDGSDTTGNGAFNNPYATVAHAMASITDAAIAKKYVIDVAPGEYDQVITIKPFVWIRGADATTCRLGAATPLDASWGVGGNQEAGFDSVTFVFGAPTFDFNAVGSSQGKLFFDDVTFNGTPVFTAFGNINQVVMQNCRGFAGYTQTGVNLSLLNTAFQNNGTITMLSTTRSPTLCTALGGGTDGNFFLVASPGDQIVATELYGFGIAGTVQLSGANTSFVSNNLPDAVELTNAAPAPVFGGAQYVKSTDVNVGNYNVLETDVLLKVRETGSGACSINLPAISATGDGRDLTTNDSAYNASVHNITLVRNGTDKINNVAGNFVISTNGASVRIVANALSSNWEVTT